MLFFKKKDAYKFTDKKMSRKGLVSVIFFAIEVALIVAAVYISYKHDGNGGKTVGAFGILALMVSMIGTGLSLMAFREDDVFLRLPWIGVVTNVLMLLFLISMIIVGM